MTTTVAVAGGSLGGLTTASLLRDMGCDVTVHERTPETLQARGAGMHPPGGMQAGVVVETMVALVLARAVLEKFGGDSLAETRANVDNYLRAVAEREPSSQPVQASG